MKGLWKQAWQMAIILFATAALGAAETTTMPPPGTLNYVEGQVTLGGEAQSPKSVGSSFLETGQVLATRSGHAELLLTPGVYLRVGHNSAVKLISPDLTDTEVRLEKGSAMLEVDELFKQNNLHMVVDSATAKVEKDGLYDFNTSPASVSVLDGKAKVVEGDQQITLKKGREVLLAAGEPLRGQKFDKRVVESEPLYRWSKLRSEYASEANVEIANSLWLNGWWYGPGWYWAPYWRFWAFMPPDGILWGPFGWGFYSPLWVRWAPYYAYHLNYYRYPVVAGRTRLPLGRYSGPEPSGFRSAPHAMSFPTMGSMGMRMGGFHGGFGHRG